MDLILWRHAEALERGDAIPDLERPLTPKGERQAQRVAQWLHRHLPESTRVLASPALRTRQTAEALGLKVRLVDELAPDRSVADLLRVARWPDARGPVLVVGHQPTLGLAAARLLAGTTQAWAIRKGAVWWLRSREREGRAEAVLHAVLSAEML